MNYLQFFRGNDYNNNLCNSKIKLIMLFLCSRNSLRSVIKKRGVGGPVLSPRVGGSGERHPRAPEGLAPSMDQ